VITARTDVVGSLLRPRELLQARQRLENGEIDPPEFKWVEDAAVEAAIRLQEDAGLAVITDGEMRRLSFQSQLTEAVEGFSDWDLDAFLWGDWHGDEVGNKRVKRPPIAVLGQLRRRRFLSAEEFTYARTDEADPQGHAAQPEPVCQLLRSAALPRCLSDPGELPGRRRRDPS
jgi:5-methyltetrahydropteroyltriglutamate--homocysteine methyltransferase